MYIPNLQKVLRPTIDCMTRELFVTLKAIHTVVTARKTNYIHESKQTPEFYISACSYLHS